MAKFIVTIQQTITTEVEIDAESASEARRKIDEYGPAEAAMDMAISDTKTDRVKSVRKAA